MYLCTYQNSKNLCTYSMNRLFTSTACTCVLYIAAMRHELRSENQIVHCCCTCCPLRLSEYCAAASPRRRAETFLFHFLPHQCGRCRGLIVRAVHGAACVPQLLAHGFETVVLAHTCRRRSGRVRPRSVNALRPAGPPVLGCSEDGLAGDWTPSARAVRPWGSERIRIGCRVAVARGCVGFHSRALPVRVRPVAATEPAARQAHLPWNPPAGDPPRWSWRPLGRPRL